MTAQCKMCDLQVQMLPEGLAGVRVVAHTAAQLCLQHPLTIANQSEHFILGCHELGVQPSSSCTCALQGPELTSCSVVCICCDITSVSHGKLGTAHGHATLL